MVTPIEGIKVGIGREQLRISKGTFIIGTLGTAYLFKHGTILGTSADTVIQGITNYKVTSLVQEFNNLAACSLCIKYIIN